MWHQGNVGVPVEHSIHVKMPIFMSLFLKVNVLQISETKLKVFVAHEK